MSPPAPGATYEPPSADDIARRQNDEHALRLLLAQRRYYANAKRWANVRNFGVAFVAIAAPIASAVWPPTTTWAAALAGGWIFLSRTLFNWLDRLASAKGAVVQEQFDAYVFDMPTLGSRSTLVSPEDIDRKVGHLHPILEQARSEHLENWYPVDPTLDGRAVVAIAQRSNAAYAERLLFLNASWWLGLTIGWILVAIVLGIVFNFSVEDFLLALVLPLLPVLLDSIEQWRNVARASRDRRALAAGIRAVVESPTGQQNLPARLTLWQDQLFGLRRDAPQIPNFVYAGTRRKNELTMSEVAAQMGDVYKRMNAHEGGV